MNIVSKSRATDLKQFLSEASWGKARWVPLSQDASTRHYIRLIKDNGQSAMLMDAPPFEKPPCPPEASDAERRTLGWNALSRLAGSRVEGFTAIADYLRGRGFSAPEIYAHDAHNGFALIEDFGMDREFARLIERGKENESVLYKNAASLLAELHSQPAPKKVDQWPILEFDGLALKSNADLFVKWVPQLDASIHIRRDQMARWETELAALIEAALSFPREFCLRDFHAENLLWLPSRSGLARIGVLDFQDAINGWDGWDMAMLVQDARRHVSRQARQGAIKTYLDRTGKNAEDFETRLAILGTLNALRITGLFARLKVQDNKAKYLEFMPRQKEILAENLAHTACSGMAALIHDIAPSFLTASL